MKQKTKENFIAFLALYMMVISSGMFTTMDYFQTENAFSKAPSCDMSTTTNDACTCSCNMESAKDCNCCSVNKGKLDTGIANKIIISGCTCGDFPGHEANFIALKFIVEVGQGTKLYPGQKKYIQVQNSVDQIFKSPIDHPPSFGLC
jgi:hypothetical protein